jgi:hypothetical protein
VAAAPSTRNVKYFLGCVKNFGYKKAASPVGLGG